MEKWKENIRWFLMGMIPTLCVIGLVIGLFFVWYNSRAMMVPQKAPLTIQMEAPGEIVVQAAGKKAVIQLPVREVEMFFSRHPALLPRTVRLAAWGRDFVREYAPQWEEYLRGFFTH